MTNSKNGIRIPPHSENAERSVLGALMIDKEAITKIADILNVGDFYFDKHNKLYEAALSLYNNSDPIDVLSIANTLEENNHMDEMGGASAIAELVASVPSASNITYYAKVVKKKAVLRKLISTAAEIGEMGYNEAEEIDKLLDEAEQKLFSISQKTIKQEFTPIKKILGEEVSQK